MELAGTRLKKIRLEKGISLEEVSKKTKIHLNILRDIEDDNLVSFSPIYIKGFLKIYCNFLGVDPKDFIPDYRQPTVSRDENGGVRLERAPKQKLKSGKFKLKLSGINPKILLGTLLIILIITVLYNLGKFIASKRFSLTSKNKAVVVLPVKSDKKSDALKQDKKASSAMTKYPITATASGLRLGIRAKEDCLVQLKSDGRLIFAGVLRKGKAEVWQAKEKIELSLGNAAAVELEINSKIIPPLGRKGQPLKNIVITKDGGLVIPR